MKKINIYVHQKYVDLNVISAYQALTIYLKKTKCLNLKRFINWQITVDTQKENDEIVTELTEGSYLLCNPNKENIATSLDFDKEKLVYLDVKDKLHVKNNYLKGQLSDLSNLKINSIEKSIIWCCKIDESDHKLCKNYVENELLGISGVHSGILLNPIYESYSFLN